MLGIIGRLAYAAAGLYLLVLLIRMVLDWLRFLVPGFAPRGVLVILANLVYAATDPPIRWLRGRIPPLRLGGGVSLDIGFMLLFIGVIMVQRLALLLVSLG